MPERETVRISQLTLKANENKQFISVQCVLSNGMKSPVYSSLMASEAVKSYTIFLPEDKQLGSIAVNDAE